MSYDFARVRLLRHPLPISLLILREKTTVLQSRRRDVCIPVSAECWGKPLIGCNVNAMTQIISSVNCYWRINLRIDSPGKTSAFVDSLLHLNLFTCITALWNKHVKLTDHRCLLHRLPVRLFPEGGYRK